MNRSWYVLIAAVGSAAAMVAATGLAASRAAAPRPSHGLSPAAARALAGPRIAVSAARRPVYCDLERVAIDRGWLPQPTSGCPIAPEAAERAALLARDRGRVAQTTLMRASWSDWPEVVKDRLVWVVVLQDGALTSGEWSCDPLGPGQQTHCPPMPDTLDRVYLVDASSARVLMGITIFPPWIGT